jgi:hypothetical protein
MAARDVAIGGDELHTSTTDVKAEAALPRDRGNHPKVVRTERVRES